ncbi:Protein KINESIN LIGHT CHAIN-RELATED 3 [Glycine soja]|uniref:Protein KINESIN LIGHT CHAIN-RELATED 3 n=1 Tax=Glycine soja TaxID=3848 RepID=A0A445G491_GLYSO|nr:Protein KINESIN LIGHT CHAIN-RELATED 3 [Glycine soja]
MDVTLSETEMFFSSPSSTSTLQGETYSKEMNLMVVLPDVVMTSKNPSNMGTGSAQELSAHIGSAPQCDTTSSLAPQSPTRSPSTSIVPTNDSIVADVPENTYQLPPRSNRGKPPNGKHESALEHLVLASMAMVANAQDVEVASVDCNIGDTNLSLARYDEAIFAYERALTVYKTHKGENHPSVGSVYVSLADLHCRTWKVRESKSYCESALKIYENPMLGVPPEEMGVMYYVLENYTESYNAFKNAVSKLHATGEKKSAFFGTVLNQMGLACVQLHALDEAAELFEEARVILEQENGPCHPETLGVYGNLAGTYDAIGSNLNEILENIVVMRKEKLGTANPDVDEKRRLDELLRETGRVPKTTLSLRPDRA